MKDNIRPNVIVYGPYSRPDGRKHVVIYWSIENKRQTMSYPKWLMEQHLGRVLVESETVDHKNRDFTDDRLENLQILIRPKHAKLDAKRVLDDVANCVYCGNPTTRLARDRRYSSKQGKAGPFCSRSCSGKYGADLQHQNIDKLPAQNSPESKYYKLDK